VGKRLVIWAIAVGIVSGCSPGSGANTVVPGSALRPASSGSGYTVTVLPSLGGTNSAANSINNNGWPMGTSFLSGNTIMHAALWQQGNVVDLGTLGGPNSAVEWPVENDRGYVSGISETSKNDPLGESTSWSCHAFLPDNGSSGKTCVAFVWHAGKMHPLPTLGGNNGYGAGMNAGNEIVGWAETKKHDSTCVAPQVLQFLPATWNAMSRKARALPTMTVKGKTDPDGAATAVNRSGEVVGISGICYEAVGSFTAHHAVLWKNGKPIELQTLGGRSWNTPTAINDAGQIVGFLNQRGKTDRQGNPDFISVIWTDPSKPPTKIGALPGDSLSEPTSINDSGVVLGVSIPSSHVYLWQNGSMTDLTKLLLETYPSVELVSVGGINDSGAVAGQGCELVSGACPSSGATFVTVLVTPSQ
jgi:probable HAF family extracellular repeat protein